MGKIGRNVILYRNFNAKKSCKSSVKIVNCLLFFLKKHIQSGHNPFSRPFFISISKELRNASILWTCLAMIFFTPWRRMRLLCLMFILFCLGRPLWPLPSYAIRYFPFFNWVLSSYVKSLGRLQSIPFWWPSLGDPFICFKPSS